MAQFHHRQDRGFMTAMNTLQTPLYDLHLAAGARLVEFGGWQMPVQYQGIIAEHKAVRSGVGIFDVSHMGKFVVRGSNILERLQRLVPSNLARLAAGQAQYTVLLNEQAGIIDDVIFYRHADQGEQEYWTIIVNAATTAKDYAWLSSFLGNDLVDHSPELLLLAVQGPQAIATLSKLLGDDQDAKDLAQLPRFGHTELVINGVKAFVARTGYTGEDGIEVMLPIPQGRQLWQDLLGLGVVPCGLGCRDTLRLEAGMHLYGQDMNDQTTPLEADLGWLIHWQEKDDFIGREVLAQQKQQGLTRKLVGLTLTGRNIARHDYPILDPATGAAIGIITSGTLSPTLGYPVAMGYVPLAMAQVGQTVQVQIRQQAFTATVVKRPFYKAS
ncbi:MAG: glycine cleavage system aminomethyltransferase GcvT [Pseudanabaena sp. ELA607]